MGGQRGEEGHPKEGKLTKRGNLATRQWSNLTQFCQPGSHHAIYLIQDEDDHQVDDDGGGRDGHTYVRLDFWIWAHRHEGGGGDAVDDDTEDSRASHSKLHGEKNT